MCESVDKSKAACESAELVRIEPLGDCAGGELRFARLQLAVKSPAWAEARPGQFVMLRPQRRGGLKEGLVWGHDILWARAFSISETAALDDGRRLVSLFLQVVGRATPHFLAMLPGDELLIWGPLGNCFALEPDAPTLLLAGGLGLAPFIGYAKTHPRPENLRLEFGHRVPLCSFPWKELPAGLEAHAHFEQCSADLTAFLARIAGLIENCAARNGLALACGPKPFLRYVQGEALKTGARAQLSLETQMACGSGACLGCTVEAGPELKDVPEPGWPVQVCLRGPVFWAGEVVL